MCTAVYCCALLCTAVYCCVLLCTVMYCCALMCTVVYCCVLLCTVVYCCVLFCTVVHCCVLMCTVVHLCALLCTVVYCCVLLCTHSIARFIGELLSSPLLSFSIKVIFIALTAKYTQSKQDTRIPRQSLLPINGSPLPGFPFLAEERGAPCWLAVYFVLLHSST